MTQSSNAYDPEELEVLDAFHKDELRRSDDAESIKSRAAECAKNTFKKDRRINIRISARDLRGLQKKALDEGIPYQTLISSVLHKYAEGRMKDDS